MATTRRFVPVPPEAVMAVLADGWRYAGWVVGTRAIREVDDSWPQPDSRLHFTIGYGRLRKEDETRSLEWDEAAHRIQLRASGWPAGTVHVDVRAEPVAGGCLVSIVEHPQEGWAARFHNPLIEAFIYLRNVASLRRLERLARDADKQG